MECDNVRESHDPITIAEDQNAMRVLCKTCKHQYVIRKDPIKGVPEKREYAKIYKRDILQGNDNLFYKYHPEYLNV